MERSCTYSFHRFVEKIPMTVSDGGLTMEPSHTAQLPSYTHTIQILAFPLSLFILGRDSWAMSDSEAVPPKRGGGGLETCKS